MCDKYNFKYYPNVNIEEDATFYILFVGGNELNVAETIFKVNLIANKFTLVGVTYADYTPPLNYYEKEIGSSSKPYDLYVGSITKFIPIFTKSNDLVKGKEYVLEEYIEKCTYTSSDTTNFPVGSNGELTAKTAGQSGSLTLTYEDQTPQVIYYESVDDKKVAYSVDGAEIEGLTHASSQVDFYFEQTIRSNYSGIPDLFTITIGNNVYNLTDIANIKLNNNVDANLKNSIKVYEIDASGNISNTVISKYNPDAYGYAVKVDNNLINETISVTIEYPIVYTITLDLQCKNFNSEFNGVLRKTFKIVGGTQIKSYFDDVKIAEIKKWIEEAQVFGYVFTGFYLVNDANSISSYGISFEKLVTSEYIVNASNTFYGRWSYLVELVEAPGTHIKTGFNSSYMFDYVINENTIQIPINSNQGYVFRVDKDSYYVGEVDVEAYIVKEVNGVKEMNVIPIEYYQGNKNLYYIRPEHITGYLVIMTNVGNSEVIVGEHTSSVTENITTEDGVLTFKYVVNHYNDGTNKSYIYNLKDKNNNAISLDTLKKEFVLDFYKQSTHADLKLPDFTEIRVYYNSYINGSTTPNKTIVGTYITHNDDRVYLTEFKLLDLETDAFPSDMTFAESLKDYKQVTEVYYFTITPPNGYTEKVQNEVANYVIECGYCNGKANNHGEIEYLKGVRTTKELVNQAELGTIVGENNFETSRQDKIYQITPSRNTLLEKVKDNTYKFTDDKTFSVYDIKLINTQKLPDFNYISLYDYGKDSILESSIMSFGIKELHLTLGYRLGPVNIYGKIDEKSGWTLIATIEVKSAVYQEYVINFPEGNDPKNPYPYHAYKIDNISTNEIRVSQIDVLSATNGVLYEGPIVQLEETSFDVENDIYTYSLVNQIIGDSRHDGKQFILSIQLNEEDSKIIDSIIGNVYIKVKNIGLDINHYVYLDENSGKGIAYVNLSTIIKTLNVKSIEFEIYVPSGAQIYDVELLEVTNEYKPAQGEVRFKYSTLHKHTYVDGKCSCGHVDVDFSGDYNYIYYDLNGGTWLENSTFEKYGDLFVSKIAKDTEYFELPIPVRDGYTFIGWYEVGQKVNDTIAPRNCLLVARWEKNVNLSIE